MKTLYRTARFEEQEAYSALVTGCDFCKTEISEVRGPFDADEPEEPSLPAGDLCARCTEIFNQLVLPVTAMLREELTSLVSLFKLDQKSNAEIRDILTARNNALQVELHQKEEALKTAALLSLSSTSLLKGESTLDLSARAAVIKESRYLLLLRDGADNLERVLFGGVPTEKTEVESLGVTLLEWIKSARRAVEVSGRSLPAKGEKTEEEEIAAEKREAFDHAVKIKDAGLKQATAKQAEIAKRNRRRSGHNNRG